MSFAGRRVVLGVSGGIASYKACTIARRLTEAGATVDVAMTASAGEFVRPLTFEALTGRPVLTSLWERGRALAHVDLPRDVDLIIIAPATANVIARAAHGLADDVLTALLLAADGPVLVAPAMNDRMYAHPATQANLAALEGRGWQRVGPAVGSLAEGPSERPGRMAEPEEVLAYAARALAAPRSRLRGRRVVVTAGPTRERLDPVRVLTNPSSGRMGYALAAAAFTRGADVVLVSGPTTLPPPVGAEFVGVESTEDLSRAVDRLLPETDLLVMAAAPADYRPRETRAGKRPRGEGGFDLALESTPDVLAGTVARRRPGAVVVGFALEAGGGDGVARARAKLEAKRLDLIVLNYADEAGSGFAVETNRATIVTPTEAHDLGPLTKGEVAERVLDAVEGLL